MSQIAYVSGDTFLYWNSLILAGAVLTGLLLFWAAYLRSDGSLLAGALACPVAIGLSLVLGRFLHWYFLPDSYHGLMDAMTQFSSTGYALTGVFLGGLLTGLLFRALGLVKNLPGMLDCMSVGGAGAIALGRLGSFFTSQDRGEILTNFTDLPWAYPVTNPVTGLPEYRFATFLIQAAVTGIIALGLIALYWLARPRKKFRDGDVTLLFLLSYCASQIVLDSTRYDALRLRINGFISAVQVFSAITMAAVMSILILRLWKQSRKPFPCILGAVGTLLGFGGAGYLEYHVQRHGDQALGSYVAMAGCTATILILGIILWHLASRTSQSQPRQKQRGYQGRFLKT